MSTIKVSEGIGSNRRSFLRSAAMGVAVAELIGAASADSQSSHARVPPVSPGTHTSFGPIKQIDAGLLNVGYAEAGPAGGPPVILLQGWPYDIHSYVDVAPLLASAGYRVIVPYVRGCGTTRFLSSAALRNGQASAVAADVVDLMDALGIDRAIVAGFDWGTRSACIVAALWPENMLDFASRHNISPLNEHFPMSQINQAFDRLASGRAHYRIVLDADF